MHYRSEKDRKVVSKEVGIGREGKKRRGRGTEESSRLTNVGDNGVSSIHDHDCRMREGEVWRREGGGGNRGRRGTRKRLFGSGQRKERTQKSVSSILTNPFRLSL